jgi:hypothetical protein
MRGLLVVAIAVIGASVACGKGKRDEAAARNQRCAEAVADGKVAEARAWLGDPKAMGFEVGKDVMGELVEAFYAAGAAKVRAAYSELEDEQISSLLVIDLPADAGQRGAVFAKYAQIAPDYELDPEKDVGQACLLVGLD